jgi:hypothetical protein
MCFTVTSWEAMEVVVVVVVVVGFDDIVVVVVGFVIVFSFV